MLACRTPPNNIFIIIGVLHCVRCINTGVTSFWIFLHSRVLLIIFNILILFLPPPLQTVWPDNNPSSDFYFFNPFRRYYFFKPLSLSLFGETPGGRLSPWKTSSFLCAVMDIALGGRLAADDLL
jgi:hypothetical protein